MNLKVVNKKVYVVSDIHNDADGFKLLLKKIDFEEDDILILAGDIFVGSMWRCDRQLTATTHRLLSVLISVIEIGPIDRNGE